MKKKTNGRAGEERRKWICTNRQKKRMKSKKRWKEVVSCCEIGEKE
jgi:hypothetical protein